MTCKTKIGHAALLILALVAAGGLLFAGPLDPPAGPVTGTPKTLAEVEPRIAVSAANTPGDANSLFKITQPGSYYLTGNISGVASKHGIEVAANNVSLDLCGFDVAGVAGSLDGVSASANGSLNISVSNGTVQGWGEDGVDLSTPGTTGCRVAGVVAGGNDGGGILVGVAGSVLDCTSSSNAAGGISVGDGGTVARCTAYSNAGVGIRTGDGGEVLNCSAYQNGAGGIDLGGGCTMLGSAASTNSGGGISGGAGCTISACSATFNTGDGISANTGVTISDCSAYQNGLSGISVATGSSVSNCTSRRNTIDGILCSNDCTIRENTSSNNGFGGDGAGIHATSAENRIDDNHCTGSDRGIDVDGTGNFLTCNSCASNATNWDLAGNNSQGHVLDCTGVNAPAVLGNTTPPGGGGLPTFMPYHNFTH